MGCFSDCPFGETEFWFKIFAATFCRSRNSGLPGHRPLRSRASSLGLSSLNPTENKKIRSAIQALEILVWCAEQALQSTVKPVGINVIWREDHHSDGLSSIWALREFQLVEGIHDARRAAGHVWADYKRTIGVVFGLAKSGETPKHFGTTASLLNTGLESIF